MAEGGAAAPSKDAGHKSLLGTDPTEEEVDALWDRLAKMGESDRRKTLVSLSLSGVERGSESSREGLSSRASSIRGTVGEQHVGTVIVDTTPRKLKNFSGSPKPGPGEVDFPHWQRAAQRIIDDSELSEARKHTMIVQSLCGSAEDAIELYRDKAVTEIIALLAKIFGSTADGHDLLADFYQVFQTHSQTTGEYLNHLHIKLCEVVKHGGIPTKDVASTLLRQFQRGTSDDEMLVKLRLDESTESIEYPDLIERVRREEARRTERRLRVRKGARISAVTETEGHSSTPPSKSSHDCETGKKDDEVSRLRQRVVELEAKSVEVNTLAQKVELLERGRKYFCYRCGQDGHLAYDCSEDPNKTLVEEKTAARRKRKGNKTGNGRTPRQEATACGKK
jgi:hypothetical protein